MCLCQIWFLLILYDLQWHVIQIDKQSFLCLFSCEMTQSMLFWWIYLQQSWLNYIQILWLISWILIIWQWNSLWLIIMIHLICWAVAVFHIIYVILICFSDIICIVECIFSFFVSLMRNNNFMKSVLLFYQFQNVLLIYYHDAVRSLFFSLQMTCKSVFEITIIFSQFSFWNIFQFHWLFSL